ncbi:hypothetical protein CEXT_518611 [Caerostris extrusa]|uniref:Uncharacterized protein n=1 Tax=Caerostris extrusa TaxID=172846 RepID=A0AAV4TXX1_CAEEX|nr:hypothetical protein CEXT_518611 [Caerostris extrusa]
MLRLYKNLIYRLSLKAKIYCYGGNHFHTFDWNSALKYFLSSLISQILRSALTGVEFMVSHKCVLNYALKVRNEFLLMNFAVPKVSVLLGTLLSTIILNEHSPPPRLTSQRFAPSLPSSSILMERMEMYPVHLCHICKIRFIFAVDKLKPHPLSARDVLAINSNTVFKQYYKTKDYMTS